MATDRIRNGATTIENDATNFKIKSGATTLLTTNLSTFLTTSIKLGSFRVGDNCADTATLNASGTASISANSVDASSIIFLFPKTNPVGFISYTITGTGTFTIDSSSTSSDSGLEVNWLVVNNQ